MKTRTWIPAAFMSVACVWNAPTALAAPTTRTIVVTSTASGPTMVGTLTWAIYQANYQGADINYINFNIPKTAAPEIEIKLTEVLYVAKRTIINATSQPGYAGKPLIRLNCNGLNSAFNVVAATPAGAGSTIKGFRIINYASNGVTLSKGSNGNLIANNQIGFAPGAAPGTWLKNVTQFPGCRGIGIASNANIIRSNTIAGVENGITMGEVGTPTGALCQGNVFEKNRIGTNSTGMAKIGNASDGIFLGAGAQDNLIGPGNVISGQASAGVELLHATATGNRIFGNKIGINSAGTAAIPNGGVGVLIANGAANNWVGGPYGGAYPGNIISGNHYGGVSIGTDAFPGVNGSNNNRVEGNFIGTDGTKTKVLGQQISGVTLQSKAKNNVIRKNVLIGQVNHGVVLSDASFNALYGNWIGATDTGVPAANKGYGVYLLNASNNIVQPLLPIIAGKEQNVFGLNLKGTYILDGVCLGNLLP